MSNQGDNDDPEKIHFSKKDKIWVIVAVAGIVAAFIFIVIYGLDFIGI